MAIDAAPDKSVENESPSIYRLSVEQYLEMFEAGIFTDDDRVELLEGWIINKMSKNPRHILTNELLSDWLRLVSLSGCFVNAQQPILTGESVPEPDVCVVRGRRTDYVSRLVTAADVPLVVEVSDSSLRQDRREKLRLYAQARIPVYWIVNLIDNRLEVYSDPFGDGDAASYRQHTDYQPTDEVPVVIDGQELARLPLRGLFA